MTTATDALWEQVEALEAGRAFVDRSADRKLFVRGMDARGWLGDLVTADIQTLEPGSSRRSLLLTPTGRIRADISVAQVDDDGFLLLQASDQPEPIGELLRPYVLSSAVGLRDATEPLAAFVLPGSDEIATAPRRELPLLERALNDRGYVGVREWAGHVWRVGRGDPRMGPDFEVGALPAEAGLESLIDLAKGCFLGQESVAKVRNLGHPPTVLRHLRTDADVAPGASVHVSGTRVGTITSVAPRRRGGTVLIARVAWEAAEAVLATADGAPLIPPDPLR